MTFRLRHEFTPGAVVNGAQLGSCAHCATLRVLELATGLTHYVRRAVDNRVVDGAEPPCITTDVPFRAPW